MTPPPAPTSAPQPGASPAPFRARLGELRLSVLSDGLFRLDGGSMFGVVPRVIWEKQSPPDALNRIDLGLNCLLVRTAAGRNILIDTGMGSKWTDKFAGIYDLRPPRGRLLDALAGEGLAPGDIDVVIHTHLHLDHTGASTRFESAEGGGEGRIVPTFPNARHVVQAGEWRAAAEPDIRSRPSYRADHFEPLMEAGLVDLVEGETLIEPGVSVVPTPGHTAHHQSVLLESGGERAFYFGDIIPTTAHLAPNYVMGFDLFPLEVMRQRELLLNRALDENWLCLFEHDPRVAAGRAARDGKRFAIIPEGAGHSAAP